MTIWPRRYFRRGQIHFTTLSDEAALDLWIFSSKNSVGNASESKVQSPYQRRELEMVLTVTAKGQVTLKKEVLSHLGVQPGDKVDIDLLPGGAATIHAVKGKKTWDDVFGSLASKSDVKLTIEEIKEATEKGWAGELD
jgi:bifunctional DNA-binding transcriptional regulator/antitoxin component of YhaV-PrlF toxin-antitoxin module